MMAHFKHNKIIADLQSLIQLLKKYKFESTNTIELYPLNNAVKESEYEYKIGELAFHISKSGMKADHNINKISVILDIKYTLAKQLSCDIDIFPTYNWGLYIIGHGENGDNEKFFCWHLDREPHTAGRYIHPYYHFHAGGNELKGWDQGKLMLISSPRLPHPPMDIVLSIHFVILNFLDREEYQEQLKILDDPEYLAILGRAHKRILDPYFSTFNGIRHSVYSPYNLFPLYI